MLSFPNSPRSGQSYIAPNGQIYVWDGVKWIGTIVSGGGGSGNYSWSIAADDSTQRLISAGETVKIVGAGTVTTTSDAEGNITITGTGGGGGSGNYSWSIAADDSTQREITSSETVKFIGAGGITTTSDSEGNITIRGSSVVNNNAAYQFSVAADDSTQRVISNNESIKFIGARGITTTSDSEGNITVGFSGQLYANSSSWSFEEIVDENGPSPVYYSKLSLPNIAEIFAGDELSLSTWGSELAVRVRNSNINFGDQLWSFDNNGTITFPDNTVQTTAWTGVVNYNSLTNKPNLASTYQFSVAADDSTQRVISTDEVVKFIGAGGITTSSDAEGAITITQNTGNIEFRNDTIADINGISITNASQTIPSTASITIPANGSGAVSIVNNSKSWGFGRDGSLTLPGDIKSNGNINIEINLADSTLRRWQFGEDGILTTPDNNLSINSGDTPGTSYGIIGKTDLPIALYSQGTGGVMIGNIANSVATTWDFGADGVLDTPGQIYAKTQIKIETADVATRYETYQDYIASLTEILTASGYVGAGLPARKESYDILVRQKATNPLIPDAAIIQAISLRTSYYEWADSTAKLEVGDGGFVIRNGDATQWRFNQLLGLQFPNNTYQTTAWTGSVSSLVSGAHTVSLGTTGALTIPGDIRSEGNINIEINLADSTKRRWQFGEDGGLRFPDNTNQTTAFTGSVTSLVNGANTVSLGTTGTLTTPAGLSISKVNDGSNVHIGSKIEADINKNLDLRILGTGYANYAWQNFDGDVNFITLNYNQSKNILISTGNVVGQGISYGWIFGNNGSLTFPNNTVQSTAWTGSVAYANVTGTPTLATVATSGSYADLSNKPTIPSAYTLPTATTTILGGVKIDGTTITIDGNGVISGSSSYSLPTASASVLGGIKIGSGLSIDGSGVVTASGGTTLPSQTGNSGKYLTTDGSALSWATVVGGGSGDRLTNGAFEAILGATGNLTVPGNINTTATTFTLANTTATTVNAFGAATAISVGASASASLTINPGTVVGANTTQALFNTVATTVNFAGAATTLAIANGLTSTTAQAVSIATGSNTGTKTINIGTGGGGASITLGIAASGSTTIASPSIQSGANTVSLFTSTSTNISFATAATTLAIGSTGAGAITTLNAPTVIGSNVTQNLYNTVATTVNEFGAATAINVATNAASATTWTLGNPNNSNSLVIAGGTSSGTDSISTTITSGTMNVFTSVTGTLNVGSVSGITGWAAAATTSATAASLGYMGTPINTQAGTYTLVIGDMGKTIYAGGNLTIPANAGVAFPVGTIINIIASAGITVAITSDTLQWGGQATSQTGTRTVAQYGMVSLVKVATTTWYISGAGVT